MTGDDGESSAEESGPGDATPGVDTGKTGVQGVESGENELLAELESRLDAQSEGLSALWDLVDELQEENEQLRERVDELDARTDLLQVVEKADDLTARQRSIVLLQHLRRAADRKRERGQPAKASVDRDEAEAALKYPDVERTTIYTDMQRAARLVGNEDVCWYESGGHGESRLKLNLEAGELPANIDEEESP